MPDTLEEILARLRSIYSATTVQHILQPRNNREIRDADGFGSRKSGCGENMSIWLKIRNNTIYDTGFWTDGCAATIACGSMAVTLAEGKTVREALKVRAREIADALDKLPEGNLHCAELAAETLRTAVEDSLIVQKQPWKKLYRR